MKTKTLVKIHEYMESGRIHFPDNHPSCDLFLTKSEISDIMRMEYGFAAKRSRIRKKRLTILLNDLLDEILENLNENH